MGDDRSRGGRAATEPSTGRRIRQLGDAWPASAVALVHEHVDAVLMAKARCSVMLTGGRSAESLYRAWSRLPAFRRLAGVTFYFGDERCVPRDHAESNYGMALRTLFADGIPDGCRVCPIEADDPERDAAALRYDAVLPDGIDVLLLGVGEDGHIASLFPGSAALRETRRRVVPVSGPKPPAERLTVVPSVIARAASVFVLAQGAAKAAVLRAALADPSDPESLPARLVLHATWLLDEPLP